MTARIIVDANAAIEWLRTGNVEPAPMRTSHTVVVPLPVVGELYAGVFASRRLVENLEILEDYLDTTTILAPDLHTARVYGNLRARMNFTDIRASKMNDLWIAALCLQHSLPLLTNDRGFDSIEGLAVVHW
jgi:Predicted nucleic acid-binding protein, contains PIN domain